jgi:hypothetical protein
MSIQEELEDHARDAREPFDKKVAATMAIIAALLAVVSVLGQILIAKELLNQQKASDQWAYSQAKDIRHYVASVAADTLRAGKGDQALINKYVGDDKRYKNDTTNIQEKARELEEASERAGRHAFRMHLGEVFLEVAIVLSSLAILSKRSFFWLVGIASAAAGSVIALTSLLV